MAHAYENFLDFYRRGPYASCLTEYRLAGSAPIRLTMSSQPAGAYPDPALPDLVIGLILNGRSACDADVGAGRWRRTVGPGDIALTPPDSATDFILDGSFDFLHLAVPLEALRAALDDDAVPHTVRTGDFGHLHAAPFQDVFVAGLCQRLWREAAEDNPFGRLFVDSALATLAAALAGLANSELSERHKKGALSLQRMKRAEAYIQAEMENDLSLQDLAQVVGLSPMHFARAFKATTGVTPHRYLLQQRVTRAQQLLASTDLPIAEIALDCGFCHQGHLTTVFRRITGVRPGAYRKARRS